MSTHWRVWLFVALAILFVIGVNQFTASNKADHHQSHAKNSAQKPAASTSAVSVPIPPQKARLVPLYAEGDLYVPKTPKPKKHPLPKKKPAAVKKLLKKVAKKARTVPKPSPAPVSKELTGNRPVLELAYDDIGFRRYLDVIERVGRLFVLLETKGGARLGPEISLKRQFIYPRGADMSVLAVKRPHLVSDERIRERLAIIKIPAKANDDSVILLLTKPFDNLLWDTITEELAKRRLGLYQVSEIIGDYTEGKNGVFVQLESAVVKQSGKRVRLNRKLRVTL